MKTESPKVKNPHPLMQCGTPSIDIEADHIMQFMVFRMGGSQPIHVKNIPRDVTDPLYIRRQVGGGRYQLKAQAEGATSGKPHGCVLGATIYEWDGAPIMDAPPPTPFSGSPQAPQQSFLEQAASQGPAIVGALGTALGGIMQIINSGREARERDERSRREYEEGKRREDREREERREAKERGEAEERRERERLRLEEQRENERRREDERREKERAEAEERRAERERSEQARADQMRADSEARQARETMLLNAIMNRKDPNEAIMVTLMQRALNPPAPPQQAAPSVDGIIDAAKKLKEFADGDGTEKIIAAMMPLAATPVGQVMMARLGSIANLCPRPEEMMGPPPVVPPEPAPMEQLPPVEQAPAEFTPGPVTIN